MSIIEQSIRRPVAVTVAVLLVLVFGSLGLLGIYEFLKLPVQLTPNVDQPQIQVTTRWFGASPAEIEQEIIDEQEEVLKTVSGLREMTSSSTESEGKILLEFYIGVDKDAALNEVRDKLRQVPDYPVDVDEPVVESIVAGSDSPIAWMIIRPIGGADPRQAAGARGVIPGYDGDVSQLQDFLEDEAKPVLERVVGVAEVRVLGGREREMQVRVDLEKLAARGIPITQFTGALRAENLSVTAGTVDEGKRQTSIRAVGQYSDENQVRNTVVAYTDAGAPVYVRDVAEVVLSQKKRVGFVRSRGEDVLAMYAKRETGTNVLTVMADLKHAIQRVNRDVLAPRNLELEVYQVYDESLYVSRSLDNARGDLLMGAALAAAVLFLTLRSFGATIAIAVSIPISIAGTFLGLALFGRNLNVISLAGLTFSIGMGIDNAIVVLENIFRHREMGKDRIAAAIDGAKEVWGAVVAATVTNVAVFLPMLFIEEEAGQLFRDIAVAITIAMFMFLVVSPTVVPMLAGLFLRRIPGGLASQARTDQPQTRLGRFTRPIAQVGLSIASAFYHIVFWLTGGVFRRLALVVILVGGAAALSWLLIPPRTYLPPGNQNFVFAVITPPPGYSVDEFRRMAENVVEARLSPWWKAQPGSPELAKLQQEHQHVQKQIVIPMLEKMLADMKAAAKDQQEYEKNAGMLEMVLQQKKMLPPPGGIDNFFFAAFGGGLFMGATSVDPDRVASLADLLTGALDGIPGTQGFAFQVPIFRLQRGFGSGISANVSGVDYERVRQAAAAIHGKMIEQFGAMVSSDPSNYIIGRPETQIIPSRARAAEAGVSTPAIREMSRVAVDGEILGDYRLGNQTIDLTVVSGDAANRSEGQLRGVPMATRRGGVTTLASVADFIDTTAPQQINRTDRLPSVTLSVTLPASMTVQEAMDRLENEIVAPLRASGVIPPDVTVMPTGSADKLNKFMRSFIPGFILAAIVTYLLLAALFESFLHPFVIIMSVPSALVGGFLGLYILFITTGQLLDVLTMLGFVILIGTIINNPILIVHQALNYMNEHGMGHREAIAKSTQTRVRPIFMSVTTTAAATAPLVVLGGAGSELYRGLGAVVIGGLLVSTIFTLILTPTLMSLMLDAQSGLRRLFRREPKQPARIVAIEQQVGGNGHPTVPTTQHSGLSTQD